MLKQLRSFSVFLVNLSTCRLWQKPEQISETPANDIRDLSVSENLTLRVLSVQPHLQRDVGIDIAAEVIARLPSEHKYCAGELFQVSICQGE